MKIDQLYGPVKLPEPSRNGPLDLGVSMIGRQTNKNV